MKILQNKNKKELDTRIKNAREWGVDLNQLPKNDKGVIKVNAELGIQKKKILKDAQGNVTGERWLNKKLDDNGQTLFPQGWSKDKILEEAASAFSSQKKVNWKGKTYAFEAISNNGVKIAWYTNESGKITSFFSIF